VSFPWIIRRAIRAGQGRRSPATGRADVRLDPVEALAGGALLVDIRPEANRRAEGDLAGAVVVERIHLEWRIDPSSPDRIPEAAPGRRVVIVCNEGYASTLAARSLQSLGVDATDLVGGYRALPSA
jgi:rhodanese-related sulfurtransferase